MLRIGWFFFFPFTLAFTSVGLTQEIDQNPPVKKAFASQKPESASSRRKKRIDGLIKINDKEFNLEWYNSYSLLSPNLKHVMNIDNRRLKFPTGHFTSDLRPEMVLKSRFIKYVVRARALLDSTSIELKNPTEKKSESDTKLDLSDVYADLLLKSNLSLVFGLQNFQWGPTELISPSNPFFHFNSQQKSFFYKEKGHVLIRVNYNATDNLNYIFISEPISNNDPYWISEKSFGSKLLLKSEYTFSGTNYLGLVVGLGEKQRPLFGEYFNWTTDSGHSAYFDIKHSSGKFNYRPEKNLFGLYDMVFQDTTGSFQTFGTLGYRFEGRTDSRIEYIHNTAGLKADEMKNAISSATALSFNLAKNISHFFAPGLELLGQHYLYLSLRVPDLGSSNDINLSLRDLISLQDSSQVLQFDIDKGLTDSTVMYAEATYAAGSEKAELTISNIYSFSLGFKWTL